MSRDGGSRFRDEALGIRVWGLGFGDEGLGLEDSSTPSHFGVPINSGLPLIVGASSWGDSGIGSSD